MSNTQGESCCDCADGSYSDSRATVAVAEEVQNSFLNETDAYSLGAVLLCLLFGINFTGRQRNLTLFINQASWPTRPVDLLLRLIATNLLTPDPQLRWDTRQLVQVFHDHRALLAEFYSAFYPWLYTNPSMVPNLHLIYNLTEEGHEFSYQEQSNIL
ncbi:hypothetical protein PoB_002302500 [Plakobranchus ocellatus]|uniref:Protein kinase domain-containing protein n=1 Tax=Plakobranchus ocellatus TaxID=259542 RepID=A0AAV3ZPK6_9GAST|nr:hypothetical protein PoB_002302500 [Plakobranchus ocellatus]